jgi:hypothetical protein
MPGKEQELDHFMSLVCCKAHAWIIIGLDVDTTG